MSQISLPNWVIVDDVGNNKLIIRSKITGQELQLSQSGELASSLGIDADTLNGKTASDFVEQGDTLNAGKLNGVDSSEFVKTSDSIDADTFDGINVSGFIKTSDSVDADTLNGKDSTAFIETSDSINADTINGFEIQKNGTDGAGIINFKT
jgi:hypothetical protein